MREQLKRDTEREGLTRREEAARTEEDFNKLIEEDWNRLDSNRERRERYHEIIMSDEMFDWDIFRRRMFRNDDFITQMSMCACEMHNLVHDPDISRLIGKATDKQKAVFFPRVIVGCSTTKISHCHEMTDRNVRKLLDLMLDNIRCELYEILAERRETSGFLVYEHQRFLDTYKEIYEQKRKKKKLKAAE